VTQCDICREIAGEIELPGGALWDDEFVLGFHAVPLLEPKILLGHVLVVTKRHADQWSDLSDEEGERVGLAATRLARAIRRTTDSERVYSAVVGHHSPHFHLHLFPRYPGTPSEFSFMRVGEWEGSPAGGAVEIATFVARLRQAMRASTRATPS
jgi:histidine triad (HIT) family protein